MPNERAAVRRQLILDLLQRTPRKLTTREVLDLLERRGLSSYRSNPLLMVRRDLQALAESTPQLRCDDDPESPRWCVDKDARALPTMTAPAAAWFSLVDDVAAHALPPPAREHMAEHAAHARHVLDSSPEWSAWRESVVFLPAGYPTLPPSVERDVLDVIQMAILKGRCVELVYRSPKAPPPYAPRVVNPLGFLSEGSKLSVVVTNAGKALGVKLLAHRIASARILDRPREVPRGFDLRAWCEFGGAGWRLSKTKLRFVLRVKPEASAHVADFRLAPEQTITTEPDGWSRVTFEAFDSKLLRSHLASYRGGVVILEPRHVREEFVRELDELRAAYDEPNTRRSLGTRTGVARARAAGVVVGRAPLVHVDVDRARELRALGRSLRQVAHDLGVSLSALNRALRRDRSGKDPERIDSAGTSSAAE